MESEGNDEIVKDNSPEIEENATNNCETEIEEENKNNDSTDIVCLKCKEAFTIDKPAKLLHCLHTFCDSCLTAYSKTQKEPNPTNDEENTCNNDSTEGKITL